MIEGWHDEALLALLREALHAERAVLPQFVEAGRGAFAWRDIDAELARLGRDQAGGPEPAREPPAETACLHTLIVKAAGLSIELEVGPDCLIGQITPAQPAVIRVRASVPPVPAIRFDEHGCFIIQPVPQARFRLHCQTAASAEVMTRWITL